MVAAGITVNGQSASLEGVATHTTALDWLRGRGLTGCKEGCAEGECGACSVMVARPALDTAGATEWVAINACLVPIAAFDGQELITAEGLGRPDALHPVQREMAVRGGSQCGYCTPGFICSMAAEYYRAERQPQAHANGEHGPNGFDLHALSGNLCRCTGYRPIRDAAYALGNAARRRPVRCASQPTGTRPVGHGAAAGRPELRPPGHSRRRAAAACASAPTPSVVAGCTDWGVEVNLRGARASTSSSPSTGCPSCGICGSAPTHIEIGAALTLTEIERRLAGRVPLLAEVFPQFASRLIRNGATLGGNLGTGSPIGDLPPALAGP